MADSFTILPYHCALCGRWRIGKTWIETIRPSGFAGMLFGGGWIEGKANYYCSDCRDKRLRRICGKEHGKSWRAKMARTHCWTPGPEDDDGCSTTCMLEDGHSGPHQWTRDDQITIDFVKDWEA